MAERDFDVTVYCREHDSFPSDASDFPEGFRASVVYFHNPLQTFWGNLLWKILCVLRLGSAFPVADILWFLAQIWEHNRQYGKALDDVTIGADTNGAIASFIWSGISKAKKRVFLSLELNQAANFTHIDKIRLFLERKAYKDSSCVLVQDDERLETLGKYCKYGHNTVFFMPNSSFKPVSELPPTTGYFRELLGIDKGVYKYIAAQAGMIDDLVCCKELASAFSDIDIGCALVFHERQRRDTSDPYVQSLKQINSKNLFFSLNPLPYREIDKVFQSIDIGIACYRGDDDNFAQISMASGKLAEYLKHGKPVLMNDLDSFRRLNDGYDFGVIVDDPSDSRQIEKALTRIIQNYAHYSRNSLACFAKEFDFGLKVRPFLNFLET